MMIADISFLTLLGGAGVAIVAGATGSFIIWNRMAYFGDALSHSALLGVALGLAAGLDMHLGIFLTALVFAVLLVYLSQRGILSVDTLLGIISHAMLALGLIVLSLLGQENLEIHDILLGNIDSIGARDIILVYGLGALALSLLFWQRKTLLLMVVSEDLAKAEGAPVLFVRLLFMILIALVVVIAVQFVGILLVASLLIIPAASARQIARTPYQMIIGAQVLAVLAVVLGIFVGHAFHLPIGATIIGLCVAFWVGLLPFSAYRL